MGGARSTDPKRASKPRTHTAHILRSEQRFSPPVKHVDEQMSELGPSGTKSVLVASREAYRINLRYDHPGALPRAGSFSR